uniref:Uncharacterized protein n=1 Tax=Araneus ventricosus TaxID=182803 RepID=A0A4Y2J1N7_ARAVE|nr:hypothetical protein AVEN_88233-1 [Araneus ventricosus]GBM83840.1 hypothetical protein AVEN_104954-1 [Araneus ventricosus]
MGDRNGICYHNPKHKKSWFGPDKPSTSMVKLNILGNLYLVGSDGCSVFLTAPTQRNHHWEAVSTIIDEPEPSSEAKTSRLARQDTSK